MVCSYLITELRIEFIDTPYFGKESDPSIQFEVGVIGFTTLERDVVIDFNTVDGTGDGMLE